MRSAEYWRKRALKTKIAALDRSDAYEKQMQARLSDTQSSINNLITSWANKYADEDGTINTDEARQLLRGVENHQWQNTLDEWERKARAGGYDHELNLEYYRSRVSRLQALEAQVRVTMAGAANDETPHFEKALTDVYDETYNRTVYNTKSKQLNLTGNFAKFNDDELKAVVNQPWHGGDFSSRLWGNMVNELPTLLSQTIQRGILLGYNADRLVSSVGTTFGNMKRYQIHRLINTEAGHITERATLKAYRDSNIKKYEYMAALESRTCDVCRALDGKVFEVKDEVTGLNYPLMHPNCRCTTAPWYDELSDKPDHISDDSDNMSVQDLIAKGIGSEEDLRNIGAAYYDEVFNDKYFSIGDKVKKLEEESKKARNDFYADINNIEKYKKTLQISNELKELKIKTQSERMAHVGEVLSQYRSVGNDGVKQQYQPRSLKLLKDTLSDNLSVLPTDWAQTSSDQALMLKHASRGYNSGNTITANKNDDIVYLKNTLLHEFGHRMEHLRPEIAKMEKEFFERRTQGEELQSLREISGNKAYGAQEKTRVDNFTNPYMGKEYSGESFEILSTGLEGVYAGKYDLHTDKDYATFILGILAAY